MADYYHEHRGSKYQNLHVAYREWAALLARYTAIAVFDDDIIISGTRLSQLFDIRERYDTWALQPAFSPRGKISWPITRVDRRNELRFTSFVEMTCPVFRRDKLDAFMSVYDPELIGWGCDWWFLDTMGRDLRGRVAVVDAVTCINPHDCTKPAGREIDRLASTPQRKEAWIRIKERYRIQSEERGVQEYAAIRRRPLSSMIGRVVDAGERVWAQVGDVLRRWRSGRADAPRQGDRIG